jgi:hypothetical protein
MATIVHEYREQLIYTFNLRSVDHATGVASTQIGPD